MNAITPAFSELRIETPENVELRFRLAGAGTRLSAYFIDFILISATGSALIWAVMEMFPYRYGEEETHPQVAFLIAFLSLYFPLGGYFTLTEFLMNGQTPGKRILGIRVRMDDGTPPTFLALVIRNLFRVVDCAPMFQYAVGVIMLISSRNHQRIGDQVAGTIVILEDREKAKQKFRWKPYSGMMRAGGAIPLLREEFDFIQEYIAIHVRMPKPERSRLCEQLVDLLASGHDLGERPELLRLQEEMKASPQSDRFRKGELFLREILNDYMAG